MKLIELIIKHRNDITLIMGLLIDTITD